MEQVSKLIKINSQSNWVVLTENKSLPSILKYEVEMGLFWFATSTDNKSASGVWVGEIFDYDYAKIIKDFSDKLKSPSQKLTFKIIGPSKDIEKASGWLKKNKLQLANQVSREQSYEVFHLFAENKIKLSKIVEQEDEKKSVTVKQNKKIKTLIIDDSPVIRSLLTTILSSDPDIEVVATAERPSQVEPLIAKFKPDVMTMDIHLPEMTGVDLLKILSPKYAIPTVMISSISKEESSLILEALEIGAVDYIQKPSLKELEVISPAIIERIKVASQVHLIKNKPPTIATVGKVPLSSQSLKYKQSSNLNSSLVVIGSSTGGTEALRVVLTQLPANIPPILIVQHIPPVFSLAFANRLNELCPFEVKEAEDDDIVEPNKVLIAPGGKQMSLVKVGGVLKVKINDDPPVNRHKPSVDYLFASVAKLKLSHIVGVILTGMGADGARELLSLKKIGARTIAQNQETCIVWGMPREAAKIGAAEFILALDAIPQKIMDLIP